MSKLKVSSREIGHVWVFDLEGDPTQETLQQVAWKIQRSIRRHRLQRVILNLQLMPSLEPIGLRQLLAACIRPQCSLIYGASGSLSEFLHDTCLPRNVRICPTEKEVAEDLGPFLLEKESEKSIESHGVLRPQDSVGYQLERRRSKRMHVALPVELTIYQEKGEPMVGRAIATNISDGGVYLEYLDLAVARLVEHIEPLEGLKTGLHIFPNANFPEEFFLEGKIVRKELIKQQLGIAVQFFPVSN